MATYPGELMPWIGPQFFDAAGEPLALGTLQTMQAGTSTPLSTCSDALLTVSNPTTITLNTDGRAPNPIFLRATGYKFLLRDSLGATVPGFPVDNVENVGQVFAVTLGNVLASGARGVTSGYTLLATDYLVTVASTGGPNPCVINLPAASSTAANQPKTIINIGTTPLAVTPNGSDAIQTLNAAFTIAAASSPTFPSRQFWSDGVAWWVPTVP